MNAHKIIWLLPIGLVLVALAVASQMAPASSTIELLYLRPIDGRTKSLILSTALCGPVMGWTMAAAVQDGGETARLRVWLAFALAVLATAATLLVAGMSGRLSVTLGLMSGLQAATAALLVPLFVHHPGRRQRRVLGAALLSLGVCFAVAGVALVAVATTAYSLLGILVPTYWIGDALVADQLGQESRSAGAVGISLHLLPLAIALGLSRMEDVSPANR